MNEVTHIKCFVKAVSTEAGIPQEVELRAGRQPRDSLVVTLTLSMPSF